MINLKSKGKLYLNVINCRIKRIAHFLRNNLVVAQKRINMNYFKLQANKGISIQIYSYKFLFHLLQMPCVPQRL